MDAFDKNINRLPQINHINEDKSDNRLCNLERCTASYNLLYGNRILKIINKTSKKVNQYDLDGNFIKTWNSISDIQRAFKNHNISSCCKGKYKTCCGYIWKYAK